MSANARMLAICFVDKSADGVTGFITRVSAQQLRINNLIHSYTELELKLLELIQNLRKDPGLAVINVKIENRGFESNKKKDIPPYGTKL